MLLVNGCKTIGTGWSSTVPQFNPREIISNLRKLIRKEQPIEMHPFNNGWTGELELNGKGGYKFKGKIRRKNETTLLSEYLIMRVASTSVLTRIIENLQLRSCQ